MRAVFVCTGDVCNKVGIAGGRKCKTTVKGSNVEKNLSKRGQK